MNVAAAYPAPGWDNAARTLADDAGHRKRFVFLDNVYPKLVKGSWVRS